MDRQIVCFQIPCFQIALARLEEPSLRGRPVAIAQPSSRAILSEVSSEASSEGLYPGMIVHEARSLCPSLRTVLVDRRRLRAAHQSLVELVRRLTPVWEAIGPGHFYLDLTGTDRLFGYTIDTAARIKRDVQKRWGLSGAVGVASNKLVSGIAANLIMRAASVCGVRPGAEKGFLAPLPLIFLPGLKGLYGSRTLRVLELLEDLTLDTLGKVAGIPLPQLEFVLGIHARLLHQWAAGIDPTPVWPRLRRPSIEFSHVLEADELDDGLLLAVLYSLLERLCRRLRADKRFCRSIGLGLVHSDGIEVTRQQPLSQSTFWEADIFPHLQKLFFRSFKRRVRIQSMTISAGGLVGTENQLSLFPKECFEEPAMNRLALVLDRVRERYGERAIGWGR